MSYVILSVMQEGYFQIKKATQALRKRRQSVKVILLAADRTLVWLFQFGSNNFAFNPL